MLEQELQLELNIFFSLNVSDSAFLDYFFYLYSDKWIWLPFYLCFFFVFLYKRNWKEFLLVVLSVALVVLLCDQIASGFCKPFFHRFRPTHHPDFQEQVKTVFGYRGGKYGFISGHAANSFGFAVFTACLFRNKLFTGTILLFAAINAYSRIYLGVHFLSDIVVGGIVGAVIGFSVYRLSVWSKRKFFKISTSNFKEASYPIESVYFLCIVYLIVVTTFLLCSYRFSP